MNVLRLTNDEIITLKNSLKRQSKTAELYLFGSRVDDAKRGGDIDLLVVDEHMVRSQLRHLRMDFCRSFGDQKIDIILDNGSFKEPFHQLVKQQAVRL